MPEELSVQPGALAALQRNIASLDTNPEEILLSLRSLQQLGLTSADLRVHVERIRASNDATTQDEEIEENCLLALDMITGLLPKGSLRWDSAEIARINLPEALRPEIISLCLDFAFRPSDMLPPRPVLEIPEAERERVVEGITDRLAHFDVEPQKAEFFRVPKSGMTTRPAALLAPDDRVIFEALALEISSELDRSLPEAVAWPRSAAMAAQHSAFTEAPRSWHSKYIVRADIESFYEGIDHTLLVGFINSELGKVGGRYLKALESFLDTLMSSRVGLPQGPSASDLFASAYLLPIDLLLNRQSWEVTRFADDFLIGADSIVDGRLKIESLERLLEEIGLHLSSAKTKIMRRDTYLGNLDKPSEQAERLRKEIQDITVRHLSESEDQEDIAQILEQAGVGEQALWDLFYHQTTTLDEIIEDARGLLQPPFADSYAEYFARTVRRLRRAKLPDDMPTIEQDLRECLVMLAGASKPVDLMLVDIALRWFPRLAQHVSAYLRSVADQRTRATRNLLIRWLDPPADTDWATAWICNVAEFHPALMSDRLQEVMMRLARDRGAGSLTRMGAVRALAASGRLDQVSFTELLATSTVAVRAEMYFSARANRERYPLLQNEIQ